MSDPATIGSEARAMVDHPARPVVITTQDEPSGASLIRMLVVGLVLIVIGMFAVVLIA